MRRTECDPDRNKCRNVKVIGLSVVVRGDAADRFHLSVVGV